MSFTRFVEYGFLFALLAMVGVVVWKTFAPFFGVVALSLVISTLAYPFFEKFHRSAPWKNRGISSIFVVFVSYALFIVPTTFLGYTLLKEAQAIYHILSTNTALSVGTYVANIEYLARSVVPDFSIDIASYIQNVAGFVATNLTSVFTSAATMLVMLVFSMLVSFYLIRDGKNFLDYYVRMSPLQDVDDRMILARLTGAIRGVIFGVIVIAVIQGILTIIGLSVLGIERAALFGVIAAFAALIPGVGAGMLVFTPLTIYLVATGQYGTAIGVAIWGGAAVASVDNVLGPYLMRWGGVTLHPLLILLSVLGGILTFGLIGFIVGPVVLSLFTVLLEIYAVHLAPRYRQIDGAEGE